MTTREYHDRTAHSPASVRTSGHALEWDIKPFPFKVYTDLPPITLQRELDPLAVDALGAIAGPAPAGPTALTLGHLAAVLYYSAGVTKKKAYPGGGEVLFRAAPSTGALYQTEVYVAVGAVAGLEAGLYHFCPGDFALRRLRAGDVRQALAASAADDSIASRAATVVLTAIYWRNTWKYQARAYRHLFWDSGTMLANLLAVAGGLGLAPRVLTGFVDVEVDRLLGLDAAREATLELVPLGPATAAAPAVVALDAIDHPTLPLSSSEIDYPLVREIHSATSLSTPDAVRAWRLRGGAGGRGVVAETTLAVTRDVGAGKTTVGSEPEDTARGSQPRIVALPAVRGEGRRGLGETIQRRGSTREFGPAALTALELATALWAATRSVEADVPAGLVDLYLVVRCLLLPARRARARAPGHRGFPEPVVVPLPRAAARRGRGHGHLFPGSARRSVASVRRAWLSPGQSGRGARRRARLPRRVRPGIRRFRTHVLRPRRGRVLLAARCR